MDKHDYFKCPECGRVHCCPTCRRSYDNAETVAQQIFRKKQLGTPNYCGKCKVSFSSAVAAALKKLTNDKD